MSLDWLLGKRSSSSSSPSSSSQSSSQSPHSSSPFALSSQGQTFEAPSVDSILKPTDPARLHPLANLDKGDLEYIILEDEQIKSAGALPSRGWSDDLCYGTGATYLTALGAGGIWGFLEALRKPRANLLDHNTLNPQSLTSAAHNAAQHPRFAGAAAAAMGAESAAARQSGKLLLNQILNHVTRRGPYLGNSAGVLALTYNLMNAWMEAWTPVPSSVTPYASGFLSGALFRSTKGPKSMVIAGTLVMGVAAAWQRIKTHI